MRHPPSFQGLVIMMKKENKDPATLDCVSPVKKEIFAPERKSRRDDLNTTFIDLIDVMDIAMWELDLDYRVVGYNKKAEQIYGKDVVGTFCHFAAAGLDRVCDDCPAKRVYDGYESGRSEHQRTDTSGKKIFIDHVATPIKDENGKLTGVLVVIVDITERKNLERELTKHRARLEEMVDDRTRSLRESEEKYRSMMEALHDDVYICSPDFVITYMNPAMIRRLGKDLTGEVCHTALYDRNRKCSWCIHDKIGKGHHGTYEILSPKDNRFYEVTHSPIAHTDGFVSKLTILRDITEFKTISGQLQQAHKMEAIGTLAGGIAHEFNNLLGIILGNTELAMDDVPQWNMALNNLKEIRKASLRARDVVKQILALSRKDDQHLKPVSMGAIVRDALKLIRSSIPAIIEIRQNMTSHFDTLNGDATQLNQVLINLCANAAHAMGNKKGILEINLEDIRLDPEKASHFLGLDPGRYVKLSIGDTGCGIAPGTMDKIFDPYFTTKAVGEGTGMGLAITQNIVKQHGGTISVQSAPGKGTTFQVLLPVIDKKAQTEIEVAQNCFKGDERILFVDDEKMMVEIFQPMLQRLGYTATATTSSLDALKLFSRKPDQFDLVITDQTMPKLTGDDLAGKMMALRPDLPIILCTGHSELIDEKKAKKIGISAYLSKPIVMGKLARTVREVLDNRSTAR